MRQDKLINTTLIAISVLAVLVVAGLVVSQKIFKNNVDNSQKVFVENSAMTEHDHSQMVGWIEYSYDPYSLTFQYPENWHIEVEQIPNFENKPNLLIKNEHNQLVLGLYGYNEQDDSCTTPAYDVSPQPGITIGGDPATIMATCDPNDTWIGARTSKDQFVSISTNFVGQPDDEDARMLVDSLTGLSLPIIN